MHTYCVIHIMLGCNKRTVLEDSILQWEIVCRVALRALYLRIECELDLYWDARELAGSPSNLPAHLLSGSIRLLTFP